MEITFLQQDGLHIVLFCGLHKSVVNGMKPGQILLGAALDGQLGRQGLADGTDLQIIPDLHLVLVKPENNVLFVLNFSGSADKSAPPGF